MTIVVNCLSVAVFCSVLQYDAVCCNVWQCVTVSCHVLQWVAVSCSELQCVAVLQYEGQNSVPQALMIEPIVFLWNIIFTFYYTRVQPPCDFSILGRIYDMTLSCAVTWLVMSHLNESCPIWMSHVPSEWVMSHLNESCPYEWVMSHMNESCPIWMSHVTYEWGMSHTDGSLSHMSASCHI